MRRKRKMRMGILWVDKIYCTIDVKPATSPRYTGVPDHNSCELILASITRLTEVSTDHAFG